MAKPEPVMLNKVPAPVDLCPKSRIKEYYLIAEDLLERGQLQEGHAGPISYFCKMLDQYEGLYDQYMFINENAPRGDRRRAQREINKLFKAVNKWSKDYFVVELDHLREIGVDIPE